MNNFIIISASVREGRASHRVALYFQKYIHEKNLGIAKILDLKEFNFPVFEERLHLIKNPTEEMNNFAQEIDKADGVIIVSPEYNGGYPASLKNIIDFLYWEWQRKPIALASVSSGSFGASQVLTSLLFTLWKIGALVVPAQFQTPNVENSYFEDGTAKDKESSDKRAERFINELIYWTESAIKSKEN